MKYTVYKWQHHRLLRSNITHSSIIKSTAHHIRIQFFPQLTQRDEYICCFMPLWVCSSFSKVLTRWLYSLLIATSTNLLICLRTAMPSWLHISQTYNEQVSNCGGSMWGLNVLRPAEIKISSILSTHGAEYKLTCPLFVHFTAAGWDFHQHIQYLDTLRWALVILTRGKEG